MSEDNLLGDYLRDRRELVQPDSVGLPVNGNRRVNGLRREEVAMLAGISSDYYLRLEQGRDHNPSIQVLEALARVLQLDQAATDYLLGLAAPQPRERRRGPKRESVPSGIRQLLDVVGLPAFVEGRYFDVLAANRLAYAVSPNVQVGKNRLRAVFLDPAEKALYPDWDRPTAGLVAGFVHPWVATSTTRGSCSWSASSRCRASDSAGFGPVTTSSHSRGRRFASSTLK